MNATGGMVKRSIVLVGAGNAHVQVVRKWAMDPIEGAELTIINDTLLVPYSGMIPGYVSGQYSLKQIEIDLAALCGVAGVKLIHAKVQGIDRASKHILLEGRPKVSYDILSLNVGSKPLVPKIDSLGQHAFGVKPLATLLDKIEAFETELKSKNGKGHFVVVGSGAAGTELTLAVRRRLKQFANLKITLLEGNDRILPGYPSSVSKVFEKVLSENNIEVKTKARVQVVGEATLQLESGESLPYDGVLWATRAAPTKLIEDSGFKVDKRGFVKVHDSLVSESDPAVFASGDCASLRSHPDLPKAGVFAVREGPVLWENLKRKVRDKTLKNYKPQKLFLTILNCSDDSAVLCYAGFGMRGKFAWGFKKWIDRRWMEKFQDLEKLRMEPEDETSMRCGGCGAKIPSQVLHDVLNRLDIPQQNGVLIGCRDGEDASVMAFPESGVEVQSVDYFRSFISDPFLFGRIAAQNALSDLYAMNATPVHAQAIVTLPYAKAAIQEEFLFQMLSGAIASLRGAGATLSGGHTSEGAEMALGFSVSGIAEEEKLFRKGALRPNQKLVLTQPLGSGALLAGLMQGSCTASWYQEMLEWLLCSNQGAAKVFDEFGVRACTDITGFGLAGHLFEMLDSSGLSARLYPNEIPTLQGFEELSKQNIYSTLHTENLKVSPRVKESVQLPILFDPQTSGGLLAGVDADLVFDVTENLKKFGYSQTAVIGETFESNERPSIC